MSNKFNIVQKPKKSDDSNEEEVEVEVDVVEEVFFVDLFLDDDDEDLLSVDIDVETLDDDAFLSSDNCTEFSSLARTSADEKVNGINANIKA